MRGSMSTHDCYVVELPLRKPLMTSNDQRRAHWTTVRKAKADTEMLVTAAARKAKTPRFDRCHVTIIWFCADSRVRDVDALGPCLKACLDALVRCGRLTSDDHRHVLSTRQIITIDRARPRITIHIQDADAAARIRAALNGSEADDA